MRKLSKGVAVIVAIALLLCIPASLAADDSAQNGTAQSGVAQSSAAHSGAATVVGKDEVVYARLSSGGDVRDVYVVNHFSLEGGGVFSDYGEYVRIVNLTDLEPLIMDGDAVSLQTTSDSFFYQGDLAKSELPWIYAVEYKLDGATIQAETLGGTSGKLEISINSQKHSSIDSTFFDNYMQQITITLSIEKCSNITADGATVASVGKNRILVYTVLPKQNARINITANVSDFEMSGIEITAMPFSMNFNIPDIDDMLDDFSLLASSIQGLSYGVDLLDSGATDMVSGTAQLKTGSSDFRIGLNELDANSGQIIGASAVIRDALVEINSALSGAGDAMDLSQLAGIPVFFTLLNNSLNQLTSGLSQLRDGYSTAYTALDAAIAGIPSYQIDEALFGSLYGKATEDECALLDHLKESYSAAVAVKSTYSNVKNLLSSVTGSIDSAIASVDPVIGMLDAINSQLGALLSGGDMLQQLEQLSAGLKELSDNYGLFHSGLAAFVNGTSSLAEGYAMIDDGFLELFLGIEVFSGGISDLNAGVALLASETQVIPDRVKEEIDNLMSDYTAAPFKAVSFTSGKNENVNFVQFVCKMDGIEKPIQANAAPQAAEAASFLDRLTSLFR